MLENTGKPFSEDQPRRCLCAPSDHLSPDVTCSADGPAEAANSYRLQEECDIMVWELREVKQTQFFREPKDAMVCINDYKKKDVG